MPLAACLSEYLGVKWDLAVGLFLLFVSKWRKSGTTALIELIFQTCRAHISVSIIHTSVTAHCVLICITQWWTWTSKLLYYYYYCVLLLVFFACYWPKHIWRESGGSSGCRVSDLIFTHRCTWKNSFMQPKVTYINELLGVFFRNFFAHSVTLTHTHTHTHTLCVHTHTIVHSPFTKYLCHPVNTDTLLCKTGIVAQQISF